MTKSITERYAAKKPTIGAAIEAMLRLFAVRKRWTKGSIARSTPDGVDGGRGGISTIDSGACFCLQGGIQIVTGSNTVLRQRVENRIAKVLAKRDKTSDYITWNDREERTLKDVRDLLKAAA